MATRKKKQVVEEVIDRDALAAQKVKEIEERKLEEVKKWEAQAREGIKEK